MLNDDDKKFVEDEEAWFDNAPPGYAGFESHPFLQ